MGIGSRSTRLAALAAVFVLAACPSKKECPRGQTDCGGECVDLQTDIRHCGACVSPTSVCPTGATCETGQCRCPADKQDVCGGACVNEQTDPRNCGACGHDCGLGTCAGGACDCDEIPDTVRECEGSPECVDIASDPRNCNGCGLSCHLTDEQCVSSACACAAPLPDECPTSSPSACVNVLTDVRNCGACENPCVANETCAGGSCSCGTPNTLCGSGGSRVCTNLETDPVNCDQCGQICGGGQTCVGGTCICPSGKTRCDGNCVDTQTDKNNCGGCRNSCAAGETCAGGRCATLVCNGTACQGGTACCSNGACPFQHLNGLGQTYFHCNALGSLTEEMAREAAKAWQPNGQGQVNCECLAWLTDGLQCGQWCFTGLLQGQVFEGAALDCSRCLSVNEPTRSWN